MFLVNNRNFCTLLMQEYQKLIWIETSYRNSNKQPAGCATFDWQPVLYLSCDVMLESLDIVV